MSIERQYGEIIWLCDECGEHLETGTTDFEEARAELRRAGWKTEKERSGEWSHYCCSMDVAKLGFRPQ